MSKDTREFACQMDQKDPIGKYRDQFYFPQHQGDNCLYFCGNSLGLQPKRTEAALLRELDHWKTHGVEGHFKGDNAWMYYHKLLTPHAAKVVGAKESEVVIMNTLTTNLHLMMVSFYRPTSKRFKIIMEGHAFPSDQYALETQVKFHGFSPEDAIIEIHPRQGEDIIRTEDILETIKENKDELALVLFGGVNYYTGQFFDLKTITEAGHQAGAVVGFDLAHAAGNVPLKLHDWGVDFAVWCSYKYLNSGPGGPSGIFVHENHESNKELPRFAGWWGHDEESRFKMEKGFIPMKGAEGWQLSNAQIFSFAAYLASLEIFSEVGMDSLREKSIMLTNYFEDRINSLEQKDKYFKIISPSSVVDRGAQLSILTLNGIGKNLFDFLSDNGVYCDWREPNVIRLAPVPLYNSFEDVWRFVELIKQWLKSNV